ncbi:LOW QUALITY PROTEIN: AP-3 complex subunit delta [Rhodamnia argentea]|uniref:AP-3 complex subunit delta n=1 Tax=Rhodamnia argentea TaxID=178133 RepID=A0ABM3HN51_9MYRT|nr:LOW QUALITY PROTEIN: AP-3 complex subunit delta [Rhodamnia argentea]
MAGSSIMETLFQRTLEDLIKGMRLQLIGESAFISKAMEEIRREIKSTDLHTKSIALQKLTYLNSLHAADMSWAAFHAVECMSSSRFAEKRVGYVAASQSFNESTPVLLLITNQLRKDLTSVNEYEASLALECLAKIGTVDLARDLTPEIFTLLSSSKVFVRKKSIGVTMRLFEKYPDAVRVCFKRLVENLESSDPQSLSATVGVFCELAAKDPPSYLPLAPEFYRILVDSKNNWVLIKVLKIFAKLAPLEPRLAKKVVEPICEHMRRTGAKSLMFECVRTVVGSLSEYESAVKLAVAKIREFLLEDDPNLKYLGLHALSIVPPKHLWAVLENKEVVIKSLSDEDANIKLESLGLVMAMVSESSIVEISRVLVNYALKSDPEFCNEILGSLLSTCSRNFYEIVVDFDWYVSLLGEMSRTPHCQKGEEIESQLIDVGMRVRDARPELVRVARSLLIDPALLGNPFLHRVLSAAAWVSGEYVEFSLNPFELAEALIQPRASLLPNSIRAVYLQSVLKILVFSVNSYLSQTETLADLEPGVQASQMENSEASDLASVRAPIESEHDEAFNPGVLDRPSADISVEDIGTVADGDGQTSKFVSFRKNGFTRESIVNLLNLVEVAMRPLSGSLEVEILERACNILGLIEVLKREMPAQFQSEMVLEKEELEVLELIKLMDDAFSEELGPVSTSAQDRVPIPDGLVLKDNLADLDEIMGDVKLPSSNSFSLESPYYAERMDPASSNVQSKEDSEASNESTSLLAEHRKRHGLYYLPSEGNGTISNDYPPANDLKSGETTNQDDPEDFVRLTAQSLVSKKKPNYAKPRPVVVKLDEGELVLAVPKKQDSRDDLLSGAVRDILLGDDAVKLSSSIKGKEKVNMDPLDSKENMHDMEHSRHRKSSSRRSKQRPHRKERGQTSPEKLGMEKEEHGGKVKSKSSHRHGRQKSRQKAEGSSDVIVQTPVIPDFLL